MLRGGATRGVAEVDGVTRHGIIAPDGDRIIDMVEKPPPEDVLSRLGTIGVYVFEVGIFDVIRRTVPGYKREYQLTDSVKVMVDEGEKVLYAIGDRLSPPFVH